MPLSVSLWNDLGDPVFDCVGLAGFKSKANVFYWPMLPAPFLCPTVFPFSFFFYRLVLWDWGLRAGRVLVVLSQTGIANRF